MPAVDADCDRIVPIPPARKKRTSTNSSPHIEVIVEPITTPHPAEPDSEPELRSKGAPESELRSNGAPEPELRSNGAPEPVPVPPTQGAVPKKKKSFFKKLKEIDINININVHDSDSDKKGDKVDDAPPKRPTSVHLSSTKLFETVEETFGKFRRGNSNHSDHVLPANTSTNVEQSTPEDPKPNTSANGSNTEEKPEALPEEPKPKFVKKKSLFGRFESVEIEKEDEPEEAKPKPKPKSPDKEKRKSFFSKSEKQKDKIMYGRIPDTNLVNAGTQTGEKEPEQKKSLGEKVVDIQEKVHMVATGMAFTGSVLNKVGEEINDKFATKKDGKPKARTSTAANSLEMVGSVLKKTGDFEDKVNTQFEKFKKPKDDEKSKH